MITVEIRQPVRLRDWTVLTTVHVDDAGEVTITGDRAMDFGDLSVHVGGGQFTTLPPRTQRDPITRSASWVFSASSNRGSCSG